MSAGESPLPLAPVLVLTGPTGTGKSDYALALAERLAVDLISVDSAQVFRGMDIGTAKPSLAVRARHPHRLIDIRDPAESYSAGEFVRDARSAIASAHARARLPVLVGGTMLYLRALWLGIAPLPQASPSLRAEMAARAAREGWGALHAELAQVDPVTAARVHARDPQRIQRALEVYQLTGRAISDWQRATRGAQQDYRWLRIALIPADRRTHRARLATRFAAMIGAGLVEEVRQLHARADLGPQLPAVRSIGYRQLWEYFEGRAALDQACAKAIEATCQLAKRQLTWLRADTELTRLDPDESCTAETLTNLAEELAASR
jgi:tRNA dimethylallyltransferase